MAEVGEESKAGRSVFVDYLRDIPDRYLFVGALVAGAVGIVGVKQAGGPQLVATGIPVFFMLAYAAYVRWSPQYRLRQDVAGDNLYYLGFLFTLVSLVYALQQYTDAEMGPRGIIRNFGVALWTTIVGVALRVIFAQLREDPLLVEDAARLELSEAVRRLRTEVDAATVEFSHLRRGVQQVAYETAQSASAQAQGVLEKFDEVSRALIDKSEEVARKSERNADAASAATDSLVTAAHSLVERVAAIQAPPDLFVGRFAPLADQAGSELVATMAEQRKSLAGELRNIADVSTGFRETVAAFSTGAAQLRDAFSGTDIARRLEHLNSALAGAHHGLELVVGSTKETSAAATELRREVLEFRAAIQHLRAVPMEVVTVTDVATQVAERLASIERALAEREEVIRTAGSVATSVPDDVESGLAGEAVLDSTSPRDGGPAIPPSGEPAGTPEAGTFAGWWRGR